jgi:ABC-type branched-subunit amino acid transport system substrate-binding protein
VTATEIDLGNVSTVGGPVPGLFQGAYDGALAYARYVNSLGGIYGRQLVIKFKDDQLNAAQNKAATDELLSQVLGFLGSFSLEASAGSPDIQAASAPNVSYAIDQQTQSQSTNFSPTPLGSGWPIGPLTYFKNKFGPSMTQKLAFYVEDNPTAISAANQEQSALIHLGYKIVYTRKIEATETNFQGDVKTMQSDGVQGLILQGEVSTMARMASAMHDASFKIPFADWGAPAYDPGFITLSNGGAEGAVLNQQLAMYGGEDAAKIPEVGLFNTWMSRVDPSQTMDFYAAQSWAAGALLTQALIKAGPHLTRKDLLAALSTIHSFDDNGFLAPDDPAGKVSPTCWIAIDITGGKFVRDPADPAVGYRCNDGGYYHP